MSDRQKIKHHSISSFQNEDQVCRKRSQLAFVNCHKYAQVTMSSTRYKMVWLVKRRFFTNSRIFLENRSKLSTQAFGKNTSTPSLFYKFFKNTCGKSAFLFIFFACLMRKNCYIKKNITVSVISYFIIWL